MVIRERTPRFLCRQRDEKWVVPEFMKRQGRGARRLHSVKRVPRCSAELLCCVSLLGLFLSGFPARLGRCAA